MNGVIDKIKKYIPSLRNKTFSVWYSEGKMFLQCRIKKEYYGNVYEVIDIEKAILKVVI